MQEKNYTFMIIFLREMYNDVSGYETSDPHFKETVRIHKLVHFTISLNSI